MTAEELYKEFVEVTHINEDFVDRYEKIRNVEVGGTKIIKNVEGIAVSIKSHPDCIFLTYFHKEDSDMGESKRNLSDTCKDCPHKDDYGLYDCSENCSIPWVILKDIEEERRRNNVDQT